MSSPIDLATDYQLRKCFVVMEKLSPEDIIREKQKLLENAANNDEDGSIEIILEVQSDDQTSSSQVSISSKDEEELTPLPAPFEHSSTITIGQKISDVKFNPFIKKRNVFAVAAKNRLTIVECIDKSLKKLKTITCSEKMECWFTLAWSIDKNNLPVIAAAGKGRRITVFTISLSDDPSNSQAPPKYLRGHTDKVNDLIIAPKQPQLLYSSSKDRTIRLWNITLGIELKTFLNSNDPLQSIFIALNANSSRLVAGVNLPAARPSMKQKTKFSVLDLKSAVKDDFSPDTDNRHKSRIDSIIGIGDERFISKDVSGFVVFWSISKKKDQKNINVDYFFEVPSAHASYIKLSWDPIHKLLALGACGGNIHIWELKSLLPNQIKWFLINRTQNVKSTIHCTSFSPNGKILIACNEKGDVMRYDKEANMSMSKWRCSIQ